MARATFVKKARKDNPVAKKGESYWWWAFMVGGRGGPKHYSKEQPRRSQLTQSSFLSTLWDIQDNASANTPDADDLESERDSIVGDLNSLKDDTEGNLSNMPDGLQQGDTGQQMQTRIDSLDEAISTLEGLDLAFDKDDKSEDETEDEYKTRFAEEKWQEVTEALDNIDEG